MLFFAIFFGVIGTIYGFFKRKILGYIFEVFLSTAIGIMIGLILYPLFLEFIMPTEHTDSIMTKIELSARFDSSNDYLKKEIKNILVKDSDIEILDFIINIDDGKIGNGIIKHVKMEYKQKLYIPFIYIEKEKKVWYCCR